MGTVVTVLHVLTCIILIGTVLLQEGKGGGMGGAFGGANTQTVFGSGGASQFLARLTAIGAVVFMLTSVTLAYFASGDAGDALKSYSSSQTDLKKRKKAAEDAALQAAGSASASDQGSGAATGSGTGTDQGSAAVPGPTGANVDDGDTGEEDTGLGSGAAVPSQMPGSGSASASGSGSASGSASSAAKPAATKPVKPATTKPATTPTATPPPATTPAKPATP